MTDERRAGLYAFDPCGAAPATGRRPPDKSLARPINRRSASWRRPDGQLALLFVQRLEVLVLATDLDQARVDQGRRLRPRREIDKSSPRPVSSNDKATGCAFVTGSDDRDGTPTPTS